MAPVIQSSVQNEIDKPSQMDGPVRPWPDHGVVGYVPSDFGTAVLQGGFDQV